MPASGRMSGRVRGSFSVLGLLLFAAAALVGCRAEAEPQLSLPCTRQVRPNPRDLNGTPVVVVRCPRPATAGAEGGEEVAGGAGRGALFALLRGNGQVPWSVQAAVLDDWRNPPASGPVAGAWVPMNNAPSPLYNALNPVPNGVLPPDVAAWFALVATLSTTTTTSPDADLTVDTDTTAVDTPLSVDETTTEPTVPEVPATLPPTTQPATTTTVTVVFAGPTTTLGPTTTPVSVPASFPATPSIGDHYVDVDGRDWVRVDRAWALVNADSSLWIVGDDGSLLLVFGGGRCLYQDEQSVCTYDG